jgi:hypothetical protein
MYICLIKKIKKMETVYHVQFNDGSNYYFGSISAIYDVFTKEDIGRNKFSLWNYKITEDKPYKSKQCVIYNGHIKRRKRTATI